MSTEKEQLHPNETAAEESTAATPEETAPEAAPAGDQANAYKEQFLRVTADFNNYQRRMTKERAQWMQTAQVSIIEAFLPIIDDIERAVAAASAEGGETANDAVAQGVSLVAKNVQKVLTDLGVTEIDCSGAFDPALHEALMQTESADHESGHILSVLSKGYQYKDVVVRHAKVSVAS